MTPEQRLEEAHGLWELAAQRVCAMAEMTLADPTRAGVASKQFTDAVVEERQAFRHWRSVSNVVTATRGWLR